MDELDRRKGIYLILRDMTRAHATMLQAVATVAMGDPKEVQEKRLREASDSISDIIRNFDNLLDQELEG